MVAVIEEKARRRHRCNDGQGGKRSYCACVELFGLSEIKTKETHHLSSNAILELLDELRTGLGLVTI